MGHVYTSDQLYSFRLADLRVPRRTRKTLFNLHIWRPKRDRVGGTVGGQHTTVNTDLDHPTAGPSIAPEKRNINKPGHQLLNVAFLNVGSCRNKSAILTDLIKRKKPDLFILNETWHESTDDVALRRIMPPGYRCMEAARCKQSADDVEQGTIGQENKTWRRGCGDSFGQIMCKNNKIFIKANNFRDSRFKFFFLPTELCCCNYIQARIGKRE